MRILAIVSTLAITLLLYVPSAFAADKHSNPAPGFDRPGLLFATDTTPEGHFIFEQGLPDIVINDSNSVDVVAFAFNSQLRYGFTPDWEVQVGMAPLTSIHVETPVGDNSETGYSDLRVGVKHVLPTAVGKSLGGADNAPLNNTVGYYLEAGITAGDNDGTVAGGGWRSAAREARSVVFQLDHLSEDHAAIERALGLDEAAFCLAEERRGVDHCVVHIAKLRAGVRRYRYAEEDEVR